MKIKIRRLLRIARHLEKGKLLHQKFNFQFVSRRNECGTHGCALGEFPRIFPKDWKYTKFENNAMDCGERRTLRLIGSNRQGHFSLDVRDYLGITMDEFDFLFVPTVYCDYVAPWNKEALHADTTREEVAQAIHRFIGWKKKGGLL